MVTGPHRAQPQTSLEGGRAPCQHGLGPDHKDALSAESCAVCTSACTLRRNGHSRWLFECETGQIQVPGVSPPTSSNTAPLEKSHAGSLGI